MEVDSKLLNVGALLIATLIAAKIIAAFLIPRSRKRLPPIIKEWSAVGGLLRFLKGQIFMLQEEYPKFGSVFTLNLLNKNITFLIKPKVSAHFFKASESDLSQQEVYQFNKKIQHFDYSELEEATNNFSEQKLLGLGRGSHRLDLPD
ncbi:hypothetical protein L1887_31388 [Cichorium endivia]|nr:hypothetical protein L1887_31388 [Cichorium endivia]